MVKTLLERVQARRGGRLPSFMCVFGDGPEDDILFETVKGVLSDAPVYSMLCELKLFTCCSPTARKSPAQYFVQDEKGIASLLQKMATSSTTERPPPTPIVTRSRANSRARELEM